MEQVEVIASFDWLDSEETVGFLNYENLRGSDVFSFEYSRQWLQKHPDIFLGKDLKPFTGIQYASAGKIFGCFSDALPDRWGRRLIDLRTRGQQNNSGMARRRLSDWDYLKGVEDALRVGGFRFKDVSTGAILCSSDKNQIPPLLSLNELIEASIEIEKSEYAHIEPEERWIRRLFVPGSSVGGARPKACVSDRGNLYIAKFPSIKDNINIAKWEHFAHLMADKCGILTAQTRLLSTTSGHDVLLSRRFDRRDNGRRVHMASSLTILGLTDGDGQQTGRGYLDIADFIVSQGCNVEKSLEELYRRVTFNICIGNSDDHFRNHSFLLSKKGWVLSPAYDMNPTLSRHQSLLIDESSNDASLSVLLRAHKSYMLDETTARNIIGEVTTKMQQWENTARACGISKSEMAVFAERLNLK